MAALENEVGYLVAQVAHAESHKAAFDMQLDSGKKQKALLADKIADLNLAVAAGEAELGRLRQELAVLVREAGWMGNGWGEGREEGVAGADEVGKPAPGVGSAGR